MQLTNSVDGMEWVPGQAGSRWGNKKEDGVELPTEARAGRKRAVA